MKRIFLYLLFLSYYAAVDAQSVLISHSLEMLPNVQASVQFNQIFGQWVNNDLDEPFPYAVLQVKLVGKEEEITQAKMKLGLDVGTLTPITAIDRSQHNQILFLIPRSVRNIYILCGDGCEKQLLFSGMLIEDRIYTCSIEYISAKSMSDGSMNEMKNQMDSMQQMIQEMQGIVNQRGGAVADKKYSNIKKKVDLSSMPDEIEINVNGVVFKMIKVTGGVFSMGYDKGEEDMRPVHDVVISDYYIGETEVTQELWKAVMGKNPSYFKGKEMPVDCVSWNDCQEFINKLYTFTGKTFSLPTEAQWEYAARGGNKSKGYKYSGSDKISEVGWYWNNSGKKTTVGFLESPDQVSKNKCKTHPVKQKKPNELGLYDMSGNVWEWCYDWYGPYSYGQQTDPKGPSKNIMGRTIRGGGYNEEFDKCVVYLRGNVAPTMFGPNYGLRIVYVP